MNIEVLEALNNPELKAWLSQEPPMSWTHNASFMAKNYALEQEQ